MSTLLRARLAILTPKNARSFVARPKHTIKDPLLASPNAKVTKLAPNLTLIHRPPPTAESPISYTTNPSSPFLRPSAITPTTQAARPYGTIPTLPGSHANVPPTAHPIPAHFNPDSPQVFHLDQAQIDQIKQLREQDPRGNTVQKLAERFKCSRLFIQMVAPIRDITVRVKSGEGGVEEMTEAERRERERLKKQNRWGERKTITKEVRKRRKALW
ncbi:hypothetical protein FRB96_005311 [Tulasnella sp. 330]|nr:hypothetical protein FRB96_005311 [Tulasnella sp. 330]KAG8874539.1 hypothetical protein FRB97_005839 [Tulasnella sp. 331]KAG8878190.1 hypothetical protein FRB98_006322 [Tulasnella sp. 332]